MPNSDDITRSILNKLRALQEMNGREGNLKSVLNEAIEGNSSNAIAITDDPAFGQNVLTNQIQQFRSIVESGAQFAKVDESNVSECPLIYMPDTGNLVFSGVIPCLNNMKFQFVLKTNTGNGCFVWADGLIINKDNIQIIQKLYGFYSNWKEQWNSESADLERLAEHWKDTK